ncbi:Rha family transcriptional regulator [Paenibacillus chitinolyticus]|uniref:Rha family transcriptional regulator n=1 Tax=Paenibacillus chitinolyticus TaxID=79263 RepID=UPI0035DD7016
MKNLVFVSNGKNVTDSLTVAEVFGKDHKHVMRDIKDLECSQEFRESNFGPSSYLSVQNKELPKYLITQDGFSFLVMGYTGKEAARFKEIYIKEFNRMRDELTKPQFQIPQTLSEALRLAANLSDENERITAEKAEAEKRLELQRPMVNFAQTCLSSPRNMLVREVAKLASKEGVMIGERRLYNKLREWGFICRGTTEPTQRGMEQGYFHISKGVRQRPDGSTRDWETTNVTPKGQMYIINRLKREVSGLQEIG